MTGTGLAAIGALAASLAPRRAYAQAAPSSPPAAAAAKTAGFEFPGKDKGLSLLGDRPLVAETPEGLLDDDTTPIERFFIRNNGQMPELPPDLESWKLKDPLERMKAFLYKQQIVDSAYFESVEADADELAARIRKGCLEMADPSPTSMFDSVYAEQTLLLEQQREAFVQYQSGFEGAHA